MTTLERIVDSIKSQLKPHLTDDQIVPDEFIIEMINQSRLALIRKSYTAGDKLDPFYQEISLEGTRTFNNQFKYSIITLPQPLVNDFGNKNVQYVGANKYDTTVIKQVSFEEFQNFTRHRWGSRQLFYCVMTDKILVGNKELSVGEKYYIRAIFPFPQNIEGYVYETSPYPINSTMLRSLEIITFQHLAPKLGLPSDMFNNGNDETKNVGVKAPVQQSQDDQQ